MRKSKYPLSRACEWCDGVFVIPDRRNYDKRFCSVSCAMHWRWIFRRESTKEAVVRGHRTQWREIPDKCLVCESCGEVFVKATPHQVWCSRRCCRHASHLRRYNRPGFREEINARRRERRRLEKIDHRKQVERRRAELAAAMLKGERHRA